MNILVLQHLDCEHPGVFRERWQRQGADAGQAVPRHLPGPPAAGRRAAAGQNALVAPKLPALRDAAQRLDDKLAGIIAAAR